MTEVSIGAQALGRFRPIVGGGAINSAAQWAEATRKRLAGRIVWNVNSTPAGGGVAEMLQSLLPYVRGAGIDARWVVIRGTPAFFRVTKRLHHALHGSVGDGSSLGEDARAIYEATMRDNAADLRAIIRPRDVVLLHDPQTAGLAPHLIQAGALVIWRCHIGHDSTNAEVERGWALLAPYLRDVPAFVFSRRAYVPEYCDHGKSTLITPSIDAFSPKNQELDDATVRALLVRAGLVHGSAGSGRAQFVREDGSAGRVERQAELISAAGPPAWNTPLVVQVSRWDPLKDPAGVVRGFAALGNGAAPGGAELVLAGPNVQAVADDPEGATVFDEVVATWKQLPDAVRRRIHLASLPMVDVQENAAIVNALQRHASVVVQKSLHEGFGLTVTEAMWKGRPVVASAVGGIQDQIADGVDGSLLKDPTDLVAFGTAVQRLLQEPAFARQLGERAHARVAKQFLDLHHLARFAQLIDGLDRAYEAAGRPARFTAAYT
ncbi:MAG: glycosyltransferase [Candidatus Binatia bacterium]